MDSEELIFQSAEIRNLFKTENLIGKHFNAKKYCDIVKNHELKKIFCNDAINESVFEWWVKFDKSKFKLLCSS